MMTKSKKGKSAIKLNPLWKEIKVTPKVKKDYKKHTGLNLGKIYIMKNKWWSEIMGLKLPKHYENKG